MESLLQKGRGRNTSHGNGYSMEQYHHARVPIPSLAHAHALKFLC